MKRDNDAIIEYAMFVWYRGMGDAQTIREEVGYASHVPGMCSGGVVTTDGWQDLEDECAGHLRLAIDTCLNNMTPAMRSCVERSVGYCAVTRCRSQDVLWMTTEGRERVLRAALSAGCV